MICETLSTQSMFAEYTDFFLKYIHFFKTTFLTDYLVSELKTSSYDLAQLAKCLLLNPQNLHKTPVVESQHKTVET